MDRTPLSRNRALLLLGATGSGKTPLGDHLQKTGLWGSRCFHFDFGAELRAAAADPREYALSGREALVVRRVLESGALLEDDEFPVAERIYARFVRGREIRPEDVIALNGLPRHPGQAADMESLVDVRAVAILRAGPEAIRERIRKDVGGDRAGRTDDAPDAVEKKMRTFEERTRPLVDYYAGRGVPLVVVPVEADTTAEQMASVLRGEAPL